MGILATPRPVYLMDEITSDLDLYARDGVLEFLKTETETRGATIVYCTHIFDHLDGWPTHLLRLSKGQVVTNAPIDQIPEYAELINGGNLTPLCSLVRNWIYAEYGQDQESKPWLGGADRRLGGPRAMVDTDPPSRAYSELVHRGNESRAPRQRITYLIISCFGGAGGL